MDNFSGKITLRTVFRRIFCTLPGKAFLLTLLLIISGTFAVRGMDKLIFPGAVNSPLPEAGNLTLTSGSARLDAVFLRGMPGKPVILYSHGNGEHLAMIMPLIKRFHEHGYSILAYDYAGYGGSTGRPGTGQACSDVEAAYSYLIREAGFKPEEIIAAGFSLGGAPSCFIAGKHPIKMVLLVSTFASTAQVFLPFALPGETFNNAGRLAQSKVPLLIFHGQNDRVIPIRNSRKLHEQSAGTVKRFYVVENAGHNDMFYRMGETFFVLLEKFIREVDGQPEHRRTP